MLSLLSARSDAAQSFQQQAARSARPAHPAELSAGREQAAQQSSALGESRQPSRAQRWGRAGSPAELSAGGEQAKNTSVTQTFSGGSEQAHTSTGTSSPTQDGKALPGDNLESIRLIFTTKQLEDSSKLSEYSIQDKSVIQMVLRLPGGQQD
ncbi:hypothetical protein JZ751_016880 [Albula glossodonta]|uniref:Ubiquitin-like domain-containing protein n=1 Tax=Albula glossodonta TaxID=121402 RepID=A0A8T2MV07_9TELE|nr:hypothetical protein JZ751_016880 [Albula glossodonta]